MYTCEIPSWPLKACINGKNTIFEVKYVWNCFQALLVSIVILSYLGNEGGRLFFGLGDFLGVGTSVGFAIVIPLVCVILILVAKDFSVNEAFVPAISDYWQ